MAVAAQTAEDRLEVTSIGQQAMLPVRALLPIGQLQEDAEVDESRAGLRPYSDVKTMVTTATLGE